MLDCIFPVSIPNVPIAPESLRRLEKHTDVPVRVIAVVDGGTPSDYAPLESALRGCGMEWLLLHEEKPVYLNGCIRVAIEHVRNKLVAFMMPRVHLIDDRWFGKMQQIILKDQITGIVDTIANTGSSAMYPVKRSPQRMPEPGCALALLSAVFLRGVGAPPTDEDPVNWWAKAALACGGASWHAGGVAYTTPLDANPHILWRAPSAAPSRSESQSQTTPGSSIRTTTVPDGHWAFDV